MNALPDRIPPPEPPSKRHPPVWVVLIVLVIAGWYVLLFGYVAGWTLMLWNTYWWENGPLDYCVQVGGSLLNVAGALLLACLRRSAVPVLAAGFLVVFGGIAAEILFDLWPKAEGPPSLDESLIWAAVPAFAWYLRRSGVLR